LEDEATVPENEDGEQGNRGDKGGALRAEELGGTTDENGEAENKKRSERNEKAVAVGRDAGPIGVARDEKIKREEAGKQRGAHERFAAPEEEESDDGEEKNGRPGKQAVIGREEHVEESGREPQPVPEPDVAGLEGAAVNKIARYESGEQTEEENRSEERVTEEKFGDAQVGVGYGGRVRAKDQIILAEGFDREDGEDHGVRVVHVEHEASDQSEYHPLRKRARTVRLMPIPNEKGHGKRGVRVRPRGIEIHVHG
jgi:hypothetical protein